MAQSVLKTVIARYKTILENQKEWIQSAFKKPQYDLVWNRDYSLTGDSFSVNTLDCRIKLPYFSKGMEEYFNSSIYRFGTAGLVNKHGKYYLHIPVSFEVEECRAAEIRNVTGVDRGINFLAVAYNSSGKTTFIKGRDIKNKRAHYKELREASRRKGLPLQGGGRKPSGSEKTVGCRTWTTVHQRHSLNKTRNTPSLHWRSLRNPWSNGESVHKEPLRHGVMTLLRPGAEA